jgi:protein SCO1/2
MWRKGGVEKLALAALLATSVLVIIAAVAWGTRLLIQYRSQATAQPTSLPIAGFPMSGDPAPDFRLTDQFGHSVTLSSLRGREVVMAFIDARCKTLCPLTSKIMYDAKTHLSASQAGQVVLVAINANPSATSVSAVQAWSIQHGMLHQWLFLTGTPQQLQSVYQAYKVYVQVDSSGQAVHDPIVFIIDAQGRERLFFETLDSNAVSDLNSQEIGLEAGMRQWLP